MVRLILSLVAFALLALPSEARPIRVRQTTTTQSMCVNGQCQMRTIEEATVRGADAVVVQSAPAKTSTEVKAAKDAADALDEVNAARAKRGLPPLVRDPNLTVAAIGAASHRARFRIFGHTSNDFQFLSGSSAAAAGCAAWPVEMGWGSCCTYERFTYGGAAAVIGPDGRRYMHLFVR